MSDLYDKIISDKGSFERLIARIPGFKGYQEKNARRTADQMLRDHLAAQLSDLMDRFTRIEKSVLDKGGLSMMSKTRDAKDKVRIYRDRVQTAAPGYSGMWAAVKIGSEELEKLYRFDELQLHFVEKLTQEVDKLDEAVKGGEGIEEAVTAVYDAAAEADDAFKKREDVLVELDKSLS